MLQGAEMVRMELPAPPILEEGMVPKALLAYNPPLGYFASSPSRLAAHIALESQPHVSRSAAEIADELIDAAIPTVTMDPQGMKHLIGRISLLLKPNPLIGEPYVVIGPGYDRGRKVLHNEAGRQAVSIAALLAARFLLKREVTERLLPASITRRRSHGVRLACLQYSLTPGVSLDTIAKELQLSKDTVKKTFGSLKNDNVVTREGDYHHPVHTVVESLRAEVGAIISVLHGIGDESYARVLRTDLLSQIITNKKLYGALSSAALAEIKATKKTQPTIPKRVD